MTLAHTLIVPLSNPAYAQQPIQEESIPAGEAATISVEREPDSTDAADAREMTQEEAQKIGYGVGSVVATALYSPLKVTYAGLGLITGGLGYVLSGGRRDVADNIIQPAVRGSYIITPTHLKGKKPVIFVASPGPPTRNSPSDPNSATEPARED